MNALFLNLPNQKQIMRRYMCSYNSPTFLFQPIELMSLAGIYRDWKNSTPYLLDAIAEKKSVDDVSEMVNEISPEFIVTICGFECFEEDMKMIETIKKRHPHVPVILFGHYATVFHEDILYKTNVDYIIHGEPDLIFSDLIDALNGENDIKEINGLSYRKNGENIHQKGHERIIHPNELPMPAIELLKIKHYSEPFFPGPYGLIQSARGCPYQCNFCVKSFGMKLTVVSPENMIRQIDKYVELFGIKSFRFIDDTFTATPGRVKKFCELLISRGYNLQWSCLARPDTLDVEMLKAMKQAGCTRIYIGIESGSQKVIDFYSKKINIDEAFTNIQQAKSIGFELMGFFMVGAPIETKSDVDLSIDFALKAGFDFVAISKLIPYPGTILYERLKDEVNFSLMPYNNEFKDAELEKRAYEYQRYFMKKFYLNPKTILNISKKRVKSTFTELVLNTSSFTKYLFGDSKKEVRKDYI